MRDNGLTAGAYAPLADVDPPVVGQVLSLLHDAGVAAYAEPYEGERGPYQDVRTPSRPLMRVFVDREQLPLAREVVGRGLPALRAAFLADAAARDDRRELAEAEVEAAWAAIVAGFGTAPSVPDDAGPGEQGPARPPLSSRLVRRADRPDGGEPDGPPDPADLDDADDPVEHYVPPPPPPLPRGDTVTRFAWAGLLGGPLLLVVVAVLGISIDRGFTWLALGAAAAGFVTLLLRRDDPDPDDSDDGAVV